MLRRAELGPVILGLEDEVIYRLESLIGGFTDVIEQKQDEDQGQPPEQQPGQGKPPLVPPDVEIKLLRRLQQDLSTKIENFWRTNPEITEGKVSARARRTLERMSHHQGRIKRDLDALMKKVFGAGHGPGGPDGR